MPHNEYAYGAWGIAITMIIVATFFIFRFLPMKSRHGKRSGGALIAFMIALFAEMYGFPLTIYLLGHVFGVKIGFDHVSGHLLGDLITWLGIGNGWAIVMITSNVLLIFGIWLVATGWDQVYHAEGRFVTEGIYARVRHPQYTGIFVITLAFMIQWPTLPTLILWPFVVAMYVKLARREEGSMIEAYGDRFHEYMQRVPMFFPKVFGRRVSARS